MADLLDQQHADVGLDLLRADAGLVVFDSVVSDPTPDPPRYVLVYPVVEWPRDGVGTAVSATQVTITTTYYCHCVGLTAASARALAMRVRAALLNVRPVIAGRSCSPIKQREMAPPQRDESTGRAVMDQVGVYEFSSTG
jgi:hypothetical protein